MYNTISSRLVSLAIVFISQTIICLAQDKLSGTATVSPTGAAVYSVAIEAPKGVGDLNRPGDGSEQTRGRFCDHFLSRLFCSLRKCY